MKNPTTVITLLLLCVASVFAQAPEKFTYQAVVRNASNALVANAQVGVRVNILQGSTTGNAVYSESHVVTTNANGLVTVNIGGGSVLHGSFVGINWADGPYFLKTDIDPNGGNDYSITSTQQLLSVPYALYATEAANGFSGDYNDLVNTPQIPQIPADISAFNNDAGYITMDSVPAIPTNVSAFTNDAGYLTSFSETDPQFNAWDKDYNDLTNKPNIPTVPTDVSAFNNDAGYITSADIPTVPTIPTNVSAFTNDAGYVTAADVQQAAGIPTNVSEFTNDAGYLTSYTETDPLFTAWNKDYYDLINTPAIPTVPTNVSAFTNDAGYITADNVPAQVNADWNATSGVAKILNKPTIPTVPSNVSAFTNDSHYITEAQLNALLAALNNTIDSLRDRVEELENNPSQPIPAQTLGSVTTTEITYVGTNNAVGGGNVTSDGNCSILARGICWSTSNPPYVTDNHTNEGSTVGAFSSTASGLNPSTTYYVRAYVTNSVGTAYGSVVSFTTDISGTPVLPTVTTGNVTNIAPYTASFHGNVVDNGGISLQARGFVYGLTHNPTLENDYTVDGISEGTFSTTITGLSAVTTYYVRAYATNVIGTVYGEEVSFVSSPTPPVVTTDEISSISYTSATCGGNVTFSGGAAVTAKGLCYGLTEHPTINDNVIDFGTGVGDFTGDVADLTANTVYYLRAFATNSIGTSYGEERIFSTLSYHIPTVEGLTPTDITYTSFSCGGNVTDPGSYPVTARGVCYATHSLPTMADIFISLGSDTGFFSTTISGLTPNTTYYVRAYAINQLGMAYSEEIMVSTLPNTTPSVTTVSVSRFGDCVGDITSTGGLEITDKGFCYSTYPNPTILENSVSTGAGDGQFSAIIHNMVDSATYFVRAYATNNLGTAYGEQISFTYGGCGTVIDYDSNIYNTVRLGNQCWMKENLRTTHYSDGTAIEAGGSNSSSTNAYYYTPNKPIVYGFLYNWKAVMHDTPSSETNPSGVQGICPTGWHVPSDTEWSQLTDYVSDQSQYVYGNIGVAKALADSLGWYYTAQTVFNIQSTVYYQMDSNNTTGFSALPTGAFLNGVIFNANILPGGEMPIDNSGGAYFWSSTAPNNNAASYGAYIRFFVGSSSSVGRINRDRKFGFSVRCLRD